MNNKNKNIIKSEKYIYFFNPLTVWKSSFGHSTLKPGKFSHPTSNSHIVWLHIYVTYNIVFSRVSRKDDITYSIVFSCPTSSLQTQNLA